MPKKTAPSANTTPDGRLAEDGLHQVLGYQLAQASIATTRVFNEAVGGPFDLRPVEYTVLALIERNPGGSATQLAKALAVTAPNITMWIDRLEARQLVQRLPSETDKRAQRLQLTPKAAKLTAQATARLLEGERSALDALSAAERAILLELLHKVACCRGPAAPATAAESSARRTPKVQALK